MRDIIKIDAILIGERDGYWPFYTELPWWSDRLFYVGGSGEITDHARKPVMQDFTGAIECRTKWVELRLHVEAGFVRGIDCVRGGKSGGIISAREE